jgi:hypothetical protein
MSTAATGGVKQAEGIGAGMLDRILREGYGSGAWHGPDMKAALSDVSAEIAFWRPARGRHNIAEIALHHAFYVRSVRAQLSGATPEPFALEGEDWFELSERGPLAWEAVRDVVETEQRRLADTVASVGSRPLPEGVQPLDLILGITCHAVYHAGQVQLIERLRQR